MIGRQNKGISRKRTPKQTAKLLAEVVRGVAPIYAKRGKRVSAIVADGYYVDFPAVDRKPKAK